ncbi:undecaprenyl-diphosphate phosphatase [Albimonas sp. CAU 1670]|uniref:undecaprenyl-diphosphate phosphatase n=1 Tax=Albimonas sp. CAU 1670 TaxID=3032599 RepID=UPI0023D9D27A|nr:undecaprenyl-diphosphate phosphatase [Albimonas sp. CAU 1670]MDF2233459.1 undecaprenyl-diphosphate phosphatase [Albimonas sp. CAU 1670]
MPLMNLVILALIQGITEFLPISSSGHLALFPALSGEVDQGLSIDVAVHVGTLVAVCIFFWKDVSAAILGGIHVLTGKVSTYEAGLALRLVVATIPVVIAGLALSMAGMTDIFRDVQVIAWATIVFGVVLYVFDRWGPLVREAEGWSWRDAIVMGLAQAVALIPGTSRSGITITAARGLGFKRPDAARISMLMSVPTILAAGVLTTKDLLDQGDVNLGTEAAIAAVLSCVAALLALSLMMRMLRTWSLTPFVIYRMILGVALLIWLYA